MDFNMRFEETPLRGSNSDTMATMISFSTKMTEQGDLQEWTNDFQGKVQDHGLALYRDDTVFDVITNIYS